MIDVLEAKLIDECRKREIERERDDLGDERSVWFSMAQLLCTQWHINANYVAEKWMNVIYGLRSDLLSTFKPQSCHFKNTNLVYSFAVECFKQVYSCCHHWAIDRDAVVSVRLPKCGNIFGNLIIDFINVKKKNLNTRKKSQKVSKSKNERFVLRHANVDWAQIKILSTFLLQKFTDFHKNRFVKYPEKYSETQSTRLDLIVHRFTKFLYCTM